MSLFVFNYETFSSFHLLFYILKNVKELLRNFEYSKSQQTKAPVTWICFHLKKRKRNDVTAFSPPACTHGDDNSHHEKHLNTPLLIKPETTRTHPKPPETTRNHPNPARNDPKPPDPSQKRPETTRIQPETTRTHPNRNILAVFTLATSLKVSVVLKF